MMAAQPAQWRACLQELAEQGARHVDPMTFAYLEGIQTRAEQRSVAVVEQLASKFTRAHAQLEQRLSEALAQAEHDLEHVVAQSPDQIEHAQALRAAHDFSGLHGLAQSTTSSEPENISRRQPRKSPNVSAPGMGMASLRLLTEALGQSQTEVDASPSLQATLAQQERDLLGDAALQIGGERGGHIVGKRAAMDALPAFKKMQQSLTHLHTEQALSHALAGIPEDAGPLNAQRLIAKSLKAMRDLSPAYTRHFIAQAETVLWLAAVSETKGRSKTPTR